MRYTMLLVATLCIVASPSRAAIVGQFRQLSVGQTIDPVYPTWDTWVFELQSNDINYDALDLRFAVPNNAFLTSGNFTFRGTPENPTIFGFEAPDCFFVMPPSQVLNIPSYTADTSSELRTAVTLSGANRTLVPNNSVKTIRAFFSVPAGTPIGPNNFVFGEAANGAVSNNAFPISYGELVPEPASVTILLLATAFAFPSRRHAR